MNNITSIYKESKFYKIKENLGQKLKSTLEESFFFSRLPTKFAQGIITLNRVKPDSYLYRGISFLYGKLQVNLQGLFCPTVENSRLINWLEGLGVNFTRRPFGLFFLLLFSTALGEFTLFLAKGPLEVYGALGRIILIGISALGLYKSYCK